MQDSEPSGPRNMTAGCVVWLVAVTIVPTAIIFINRNWNAYSQFGTVLEWVAMLILCFGSVMTAKATRFDPHEPWLGRAILMFCLGLFVIFGISLVGCDLRLR